MLPWGQRYQVHWGSRHDAPPGAKKRLVHDHIMCPVLPRDKAGANLLLPASLHHTSSSDKDKALLKWYRSTSSSLSMSIRLDKTRHIQQQTEWFINVIEYHHQCRAVRHLDFFWRLKEVQLPYNPPLMATMTWITHVVSGCLLDVCITVASKADCN